MNFKEFYKNYIGTELSSQQQILYKTIEKYRPVVMSCSRHSGYKTFLDNHKTFLEYVKMCKEYEN